MGTAPGRHRRPPPGHARHRHADRQPAPGRHRRARSAASPRAANSRPPTTCSAPSTTPRSPRSPPSCPPTPPTRSCGPPRSSASTLLRRPRRSRQRHHPRRRSAGHPHGGRGRRGSPRSSFPHPPAATRHDDEACDIPAAQARQPLAEGAQIATIAQVTSRSSCRAHLSRVAARSGEGVSGTFMGRQHGLGSWPGHARCCHQLPLGAC